MKKVLLVLFCLCLLPVLAKSSYISIKGELLNDINLNASKEKQVIKFKSVEDSKYENYTIPKGTLFTAKLTNIQKSSSGYKKAKANIYFDEVLFPDGRLFLISEDAKENSISESNYENVKYGAVNAYRIPLSLGTNAVFGLFVTPVLLMFDISAIPNFVEDSISEAFDNGSQGSNFVRKKGDIYEFKIKVKRKNITEFTDY